MLKAYPPDSQLKANLDKPALPWRKNMVRRGFYLARTEANPLKLWSVF